MPQNPYDVVPYPSHAFAATSPDRLATLGAIFGLDSPDARSARVLELGSSSGGNIVGHAIAHPDSQVLGLDLSKRQIDFGQHMLAELDVPNARLEVADLATWRPEPGSWDYIICHGVYSWVPAHVRQAILRICREGLSPHGVAVVSWNTHPGWHMQGVARDAMGYLVDSEMPLAHQAARGQDVVRVLSQVVPDRDTAYAHMLSRIAGQFELLPDAYVAHEYLEANNHPLYLAEFTQHVAQAGLRYLSDANLASVLPQLHEPKIRGVLQSLASSQIELEQYMDFFTCRPFHTSLIVRPDAPIRRNLNQLDPRGFWLSRRHPLAETESVASWPLSAAFLRHIHAAWPHTLSFADAAQAALTSMGVTELEPAYQQELTHAMLTSFLEKRTLLHRHPHAAVSRAGHRPEAWRLARYQAARQHLVTNLHHDTLTLEPFDLLLLHRCDGTRTRQQILDELAPVLAAHPDPTPEVDEDGAPLSPAQLVERHLHQLSDQGFFVA